MKQALRGFFQRYGVALQYPEFRNLWVANAFAQAAAWGLIVIRSSLIYSETHSSSLVGVAVFAALIPQLIVPPIVGVLADRMDRRTLLSWTYGVNTLQNGALFALAAAGLIEVWMLIGFSVLNGVARSAQMPVSQAMSASLVPREHLLNALSLSASTQHGSRLIGPGIVTPLLALIGPAPAFAACTLFYLIGWYKILQLTPKEPASGHREGFIENFKGGFVYVYSRPVLRFMLVIVFLHCGLTMAFESLLPAFSVKSLGTSEEAGIGPLLMGVGLGAFIASIFISGIQTSKGRGNAMIATGVISGLGQVALSLTGTLPLAVVAAAFMGGAQAAFMTMGQAVTQSIAADEFRGRVASINTFSLGGVMATMNLLNGSLADEFGAQPLLFIQGFIFFGAVVLSLFLLTGRRVYGRAPALEPVRAA
jgi:MFS family permease